MNICFKNDIGSKTMHRISNLAHWNPPCDFEWNLKMRWRKQWHFNGQLINKKEISTIIVIHTISFVKTSKLQQLLLLTVYWNIVVISTISETSSFSPSHLLNSTRNLTIISNVLSFMPKILPNDIFEKNSSKFISFLHI